MVFPVWDVIVQMLEAGCVGVAQHEWEVGVSVIDSVKFFTCQILFEVVLNNGALMNSSSLSPGCVDINAISKSKNVFISFVLQSVWVDINQSFLIGQVSIHQFLEWFGGRVDHSSHEIFFHCFTCVDVLENSNFLPDFVVFYLNHLPS